MLMHVCLWVCVVTVLSVCGFVHDVCLCVCMYVYVAFVHTCTCAFACVYVCECVWVEAPLVGSAT